MRESNRQGAVPTAGATNMAILMHAPGVSDCGRKQSCFKQ